MSEKRINITRLIIAITAFVITISIAIILWTPLIPRPKINHGLNTMIVVNGIVSFLAFLSIKRRNMQIVVNGIAAVLSTFFLIVLGYQY